MKKYILIIFLSASLMADNFIFIADNAIMVEAYINIFSAIGGLFHNRDYLQLLKLIFLVGGFVTFFSAVIGKNIEKSIGDFAKYMILGTTLLTLVFFHQSRVTIKTNSIPTYCDLSTGLTTGSVVANIPTVFAFGASFANEFGQESARLARTAFSSITSNTSNLSRSDYAQSLNAVGQIMTLSIDKIEAQSNIGTTNPTTIGSSLISITNDCILIPASQDPVYGQKIINTYKTSGNTQETINDFIRNSALVKYKNPTDTNGTVVDLNVTVGGLTPKNLLTNISGEVFTCEEAWITLNNRINGLKNSGTIECMDSLSNVLSPSTMKVMTGSDMSLSQTDNIIINVALANQISDSQRNLSTGNNIKEMSYATTKSIAEVTLKSKASGNYLAEMLPYLQMGMRAVLYAFFPFVFVVILLPGGMKVLREYTKSIIWIELWTPAAAILDMFLNIEGTAKFAQMYNENGMNPMSMFQIFSDATMLSGVAGYLYASIPAITWFILDATGESLSSIGSGLMGGLSDGSNIVARNLNSATQNSDQALKQMSNITGETIAKVQGMSMEHAARESAGNWLTNESRKGDLVEAQRGNRLEQLVEGLGNKAALSNISAENAMIADIKDSSLSSQARFKSTGILDDNGRINNESLKTIFSAKGVKDAISDSVLISSYNPQNRGEKPEDIISEIGNLRAVKKLQQFSLAKETTRDDSISGINPIAAASIAGLSTALNEHKIQSQIVTQMGGGSQMEKDKFGNFKRSKNGFVIYSGEQLDKTININSSLGRTDGAKSIGTENLLSITGSKKITSSTESGLLAKIGRDLAIPKKLIAQKEAAISGGAILHGGTGIIGMAKDLALIGIEKEIFDKVSGDTYAKELTNFSGELSPKKKKKLKKFGKNPTLRSFLGLKDKSKNSNTPQNKAHKQGLNASVMGNFGANQILGDMHGDANYLKELISQSTYKGTDGKIHINKNSQAYLTMKESMKTMGIGNNSLSNSAVLGALSRDFLTAKSEVFKETTDYLSTRNYENNGMSAERIAASNAFEREANVQKNAVISNVMSAEIYGDLKAAAELLRITGLTLDALNNMLALIDYERNEKIKNFKEIQENEKAKQKQLKEELDKSRGGSKKLYEQKVLERGKLRDIGLEIQKMQNSITGNEFANKKIDSEIDSKQKAFNSKISKQTKAFDTYMIKAEADKKLLINSGSAESIRKIDYEIALKKEAFEHSISSQKESFSKTKNDLLKSKTGLVHNGSAEEIRKATFEIEQKKAAAEFSKARMGVLEREIGIQKNKSDLLKIELEESRERLKVINKEIKGLNNTFVDKTKELFRTKSEAEKLEKIAKDNKTHINEQAKLITTAAIEKDLKMKVAKARNAVSQATTQEDKIAAKEKLSALQLEYQNASKAASAAKAEASVAIKVIKSASGKAKVALATTALVAGEITMAMAIESVWDDKKSYTENSLRVAALFDITGISSAAIDVATDNKKRTTIGEYAGDTIKGAGRSWNGFATEVIGGTTGFFFGKSSGDTTKEVVSSSLSSIGGGVVSLVNVIEDIRTTGSISDKTRGDIDDLRKSNERFTESFGKVVTSFADGSTGETIIKSTSNGIDNVKSAADFVGTGVVNIYKDIVTSDKEKTDALSKEKYDF